MTKNWRITYIINQTIFESLHLLQTDRYLSSPPTAALSPPSATRSLSFFTGKFRLGADISFLVSTVKGARSPQEQTAARRSHESELANASAMEGKIFPLLSLNSPAMTMFFPSMARSVMRGKSTNMWPSSNRTQREFEMTVPNFFAVVRHNRVVVVPPVLKKKLSEPQKTKLTYARFDYHG